MNSAENVYGFDGSKVGTVVQEMGPAVTESIQLFIKGERTWVAYNLSDLEVYRGPYFIEACNSLRK